MKDDEKPMSPSEHYKNAQSMLKGKKATTTRAIKDALDNNVKTVLTRNDPYGVRAEKYKSRTVFEDNSVDKFMMEFGVDAKFLTNYSAKTIKFIRFVYDNKRKRMDLAPLKLLSSETFIRVLPMLLDPKVRERFEMDEPTTFNKYAHRKLLPVCSSAGLTKEYINHLVSEYLKSLLASNLS